MSNLPTQAQVVIIGGGVGGCSIAYHLTLMGWKDVVLLERHELTSGSTWHSAGLVGQMRSDANLTRMMHYSTDLYRKPQGGDRAGYLLARGGRTSSGLLRRTHGRHQAPRRHGKILRRSNGNDVAEGSLRHVPGDVAGRGDGRGLHAE